MQELLITLHVAEEWKLLYKFRHTNTCSYPCVAYMHSSYTVVPLQTMAFPFVLELLISTLLALLVFLYIKSWRSRNPFHPMDWPVVGVLPSLVGRLHNF